MKTIIAAALLLAMPLQAQDFQGMAVYESKTRTSDISKRMDAAKDLTPEMRAMAESMMKQAFEKTFVLHFDQSASVYKEEEKLDAPGQAQQPGLRMMTSMTGGGGTFYKNVKDKTYTVDKEFMGKEFLVKDTLAQLKWTMGSETRQIGGYTCYKATAVRPVSKSDIRNYRPRQQREPAKEKTTGIMTEIDIPDNTTVTAWYTPEIPVSHGPENYWGLPGLILEANDGKTVILCSKVVLNPKEKTAIKPPTSGKVVSQKEYDETVVKKMEELREMQGRNGGFQMRFGQ